MKTVTCLLLKRPTIAYLCDFMPYTIFHSLPLSFGSYSVEYFSMKDMGVISLLAHDTLEVNRYLKIINKYGH